MKRKISFIVRKQYNEVTQNQQNLHLNHNQMNEMHLYGRMMSEQIWKK
jgi:hypothetical protein